MINHRSSHLLNETERFLIQFLIFFAQKLFVQLVLEKIDKLINSHVAILDRDLNFQGQTFETLISRNQSIFCLCLKIVTDLPISIILTTNMLTFCSNLRYVLSRLRPTTLKMAEVHVNIRIGCWHLTYAADTTIHQTLNTERSKASRD